MSWPTLGGTRLGWCCRMFIRATALLAAAVQAVQAAPFDQGHSRFAAVLTNHVRAGVVDYAAIRAAPGELRAYLDELASVRKDDFLGWSESRRLAFLFNLYNASTLDLVVRHYPVKSIKDIGSLLRGPWKQDCVRLLGETTTLDHLEHEVLRREYREPRLHFALVCAARSCPPLRSEPYVGDRLHQQLEEQGRLFLRDPAKNRVDTEARTLHLSPIFQWFKADFTSGGRTVKEFVLPYLPAASRRAAAGYSIRYTVYDWSLNDRRAE